MSDECDVVYLDFNATTPVAESVRDIVSRVLKECWANPSSNSDLGRKAERALDKARSQLADLIQAHPTEIVFTSGGTEASNMAIRSVIDNCTHRKPHVVTSSVEHDATIRLLEHLENEEKVDVTRVKVDKNGSLSSDLVLSAIRPNTCLVTIMLANNETGVIYPIGDIGNKLQNLNKQRLKQGLNEVMFHCDAAQAIGKIPVSVRQLHVHFLTIVGHKFYGPRIGCLYRRKHVPLKPLLFGGGQEYGLRPGTENTPMIAGLGEAAKLVTKNLKEYRMHLQKMRDYLEEKLLTTFNSEIVVNFTECERLPNTVSVTFLDGVNANQLLSNCISLVASTCAACHSNLHSPSRILLETMSHELALGSLRLSVGRETTQEQIDIAIKDLKSALKLSTKPSDSQ